MNTTLEDRVILIDESQLNEVSGGFPWIVAGFTAVATAIALEFALGVADGFVHELSNRG